MRSWRGQRDIYCRTVDKLQKKTLPFFEEVKKNNGLYTRKVRRRAPKIYVRHEKERRRRNILGDINATETALHEEVLGINT